MGDLSGILLVSMRLRTKQAIRASLVTYGSSYSTLDVVSSRKVDKDVTKL